MSATKALQMASHGLGACKVLVFNKEGLAAKRVLASMPKVGRVETDLGNGQQGRTKIP